MINEELQKPEFNKIDSEIELHSSLIFDNDKFDKFTNLFDKRSRLNKYFLRIFDDDDNFIYEEKTQKKADFSIHDIEFCLELARELEID